MNQMGSLENIPVAVTAIFPYLRPILLFLSAILTNSFNKTPGIRRYHEKPESDPSLLSLLFCASRIFLVISKQSRFSQLSIANGSGTN
jgi:hypothetical protein